MSVAIYMEGGGDSGDKGGSRAELRRGMEIFLTEIKEACRERNRRWKLVCCGSRNDAYRGFQNARARRDADIVVLLVDSEGPVGGLSCSAYLAKRDRWILDGVCEDAIHLMVQTMEAWIVADPDALSAYYGQGFQANVLPRRPNLEEEGKVEIARALDHATQRTSKGKYHKIRHVRRILQSIEPMAVRRRCPHCERLFEKLLRLVRSPD